MGKPHLFSSPIGRLRFFLYSAAISIAEQIAVAMCIGATMGFGGFVHSQPGRGREGLALAAFVVLMLFVVARTNITWRRKNDAQLSNWLVVPYLVFVTLFAMMQAATLLVYDLGNGSSNSGLGFFGFTLFALWFRICIAPSKGRPADLDPAMIEEVFGEGASDRFRHATPARVSAEPSMISTPVTVSALGPGTAGPIVFGKRGRA